MAPGAEPQTAARSWAVIEPVRREHRARAARAALQLPPAARAARCPATHPGLPRTEQRWRPSLRRARPRGSRGRESAHPGKSPRERCNRGPGYERMKRALRSAAREAHSANPSAYMASPCSIWSVRPGQRLRAATAAARFSPSNVSTPRACFAATPMPSSPWPNAGGGKKRLPFPPARRREASSVRGRL